MMYHPEQSQHKIPQVYLKCFGFRDKNNQWRISVIERGNTYTQQKSIKSFTAATNIFDIESQDPSVRRLIESGVNGVLEDSYLEIISDLEVNGQLSDKSYAYLLQFVANLMVRSDHWREMVTSLLDSSHKPLFLKQIMGHHCKNEQEFNAIHEQPFYSNLLLRSTDKAINTVLLYLMDHIMLRLWHYEIVIIKSQDEKPWFTSTNPVIAHNQINLDHGFEMFSKDSEYYLPLSPSYLAYLHFPEADDKSNLLRALPTNQIHLATDAENQSLQYLITNNYSDFLLFAGEFKYRLDQD